MSKITINGIEYTDDVDKRFASCEFYDVRIKDYEYFKAHCLTHKKGERPCGNALYLKRVNAKTNEQEKIFNARDRGHIEEIKKIIKQTEKQYELNLSEELNWLDSLERRFS